MAAAPPNPTPLNRPRPTPPPEPKPKPAKTAAGSAAWGPLARWSVSLLIAWHVLAVFAAPWAIQLRDVEIPDVPPDFALRDARGAVVPLSRDRFPPVEPRLPALLQRLTWHYDNLLFINHGYNFFSPDPSAGHVIDYRVFNERNEKIAEGKFPDRKQQWPRLFYHRHMMLADQSADIPAPAAYWKSRIARELLLAHQGERIEVELKIHHLLTAEQVRKGMKLDDPSTYETTDRFQQRRTDPLPTLPAVPRPAAQGVPQSPAGPIRIPGGPQ